jgi:hypothetical protein
VARVYVERNDVSLEIVKAGFARHFKRYSGDPVHYEVIEITATQLDDRTAMVQHFARIARILISKDRAKGLREDESWYQVSNVN